MARLHKRIKPKLVSSVSKDRLISGGTGLKYQPYPSDIPLITFPGRQR